MATRKVTSGGRWAPAWAAVTSVVPRAQSLAEETERPPKVRGSRAKAQGGGLHSLDREHFSHSLGLSFSN